MCQNYLMAALEVGPNHGNGAGLGSLGGESEELIKLDFTADGPWGNSDMSSCIFASARAAFTKHSHSLVGGWYRQESKVTNNGI